MAYEQQHTFVDGETLTHTLLNNEFAAIESAWTGLVETTGAQTIAGVKTFSSIPLLPASNPTAANQALRLEGAMNLVRGFKRGLDLSWKDANEFYVSGGVIHVYDGSNDFLLASEAQITKTVSGLGNDTWYYVYVDAPASGYDLVAADIEYSSTAPSYNHANAGWYHGSTTDQRCIGAFLSDGSGNVLNFTINNRKFYHEVNISELAGSFVATTWTDLDISTSVPNFGEVLAIVGAAGLATHGVGFRQNGSGTDEGKGSVIYFVGTGKQYNGAVEVLTDSSQVIEYYATGAVAGTIDGIGWYLPDGI